MDVQKLPNYRGQLIDYLNSLSFRVDIIILSEIRDNAIHYLSTLSDDYPFFYQFPDKNHHGGVAIYVEEDGLRSAKGKTCEFERHVNVPSAALKVRLQNLDVRSRL